MPIIYIDGPEKSGKTTLANYLADKHGARVRHWGPVKDESVYMEPLKEDCQSEGLVVWDRGWAAEHVYAWALGRDRRLKDDPWWGEWIYGRAVQAVGLRIILLGPSVEALQSKRTPDDLPVEPAYETALYARYARRFNVMHIHNEHSDRAAAVLGDKIVDIVGRRVWGLKPPVYCGPPGAKIVILGDARSGRDCPGGWLPFTSNTTTTFGRLLGDRAFQIGWTNAEDSPRHPVQLAKVVVACGRRANKYAQRHARGEIIEVSHPSYAYRWNNVLARAARSKTESLVQDLLTTMIKMERGESRG